MSKIKMTA